MTSYQRNRYLRGNGGDSTDAGYTSADGSSLRTQSSHEQREEDIKSYLNDCISESNTKDYVHFDSNELHYYSVQNPETIRQWSYIYQQNAESTAESPYNWERFSSNENTENLKNAGITLDFEMLYYACLSNANLIGDDIFERIADSEYLASKGFTVGVYDSGTEAVGSTATVTIYPVISTLVNGVKTYTDSDKATNKANALRGLFDKNDAGTYIPYYTLLKLVEEGTITYKELATLEFCGDFSDRFDSAVATKDVADNKTALGIDTYAYYSAYDFAANAIYDELLETPNVQSAYNLSEEQSSMANTRSANHNSWEYAYDESGAVSYHRYSFNQSYSAYVDALALEEKARKLRESDPAAAAELYTQASELLANAFDCFEDERGVELLREAYANGQVSAEELANYEAGHCTYWTDEYESNYLESLAADGRELNMSVFCKTNFLSLKNRCAAKAFCITTDLNAGGDGQDKSDIPVLIFQNSDGTYTVTNGSITVTNATPVWAEDGSLVVTSDNGFMLIVKDPVFTYDEDSMTIVITGGTVTTITDMSVFTPGTKSIEVTSESGLADAINEIRGYKGGAGSGDSTYKDSEMEDEESSDGSSGGGGGGGDGGGGGGGNDSEPGYYDYYCDAVGKADTWMLVAVDFSYHADGFNGGYTPGHDIKYPYELTGCRKPWKRYQQNVAMRSDSKMANGTFDLEAWIFGDQYTGRALFHHLKIITSPIAGPFRSQDAAHAYARRNNISFTRSRDYANAYARGMEENARAEKKLAKLTNK